jgi:hypothetical protein
MTPLSFGPARGAANDAPNARPIGLDEDQAALLHERLIGPPEAPGLLGSLDEYDVLRLLGSGGMGVVLLARDREGPVAIKMLRGQMSRNEREFSRFITEAARMRNMSHPHILKVLKRSERSSGPYYVMPFIEGGPLSRRIHRGKPLSFDVALRVAMQVADALCYAHGKGILHRDLKPANVLIDESGHAYLGDFGLGRSLVGELETSVRPSYCEGTPAYMSPGVAAGQAEDTRCDIYGLGSLLYEMLTGSPPYDGSSASDILRKVLAGPPPSIRTINPSADPGLVAVAEGAMARELRDRYASMQDMLADLQRVQRAEAVLGPRGSQPFKAASRLSRRALIGTAAAVGVAGAATVVWRTMDRLHGGKNADAVAFGQSAAGITTTQPAPATTRPDALVEVRRFLADGRVGEEGLAHRGFVNCAAFTRDGKLLASGGDDQIVRLWDVSTGRQLRTFHRVPESDTASDYSIIAVALSSDGTRLATCAADGARLWDVQSGKLLTPLRGHRSGSADREGFAYQAVFSDDGRTVFTCDDVAIHSFDIKTGGHTQLLAVPDQSATRHLALSPDARWAISWRHTEADRTLHLWSLARGEEVGTINGAMGEFGPYKMNLVFSHDGALLATVDQTDRNIAVRIWDIPEGKSVRQLHGRPISAWTLAWSPDNRLLLGAGDGPLPGFKLFDVNHGMLVWSLDEPPVWQNLTSLLALSFSPDGKQVAAGDRAGRLRLFRVDAS